MVYSTFGLIILKIRDFNPINFTATCLMKDPKSGVQHIERKYSLASVSADGGTNEIYDMINPKKANYTKQQKENTIKLICEDCEGTFIQIDKTKRCQKCGAKIGKQIKRNFTKTTKLNKIRDGFPFTWGELIKIHTIGEYDIIEYFDKDEDGKTTITIQFHLYVFNEDTCRSYDSLDEALLGAIAYKYEGSNCHHLVEYIKRMLCISNK